MLPSATKFGTHKSSKKGKEYMFLEKKSVFKTREVIFKNIYFKSIKYSN